ncbi:Formyl-CoA:oxalate CoA-transferase [compost metagenome]
MPVRFNGQPRQAARPAPLLGEHSREILADLGYTSDDIETMLAAGSVQAATRLAEPGEPS